MPRIVGFMEEKYDPVHDRCRLDLFRPVGVNRPPLVVLVHGGDFSDGHRVQYHPVAVRLGTQGFAAATVGYRLFPEAKWPDLAQDVLRATAFLSRRSHEFGINADRAVPSAGDPGATSGRRSRSSKGCSR